MRSYEPLECFKKMKQFEEENEKLKNILKNIRLYLSEKVDSYLNDFFKAQHITEQIKTEAKQEAYEEILNYIQGKGY